MEIAFRYPRAAVLLGEISDWRNGISLARQDDGSFGVVLDVPRGVYQYKLLAGGEWQLDEGNPRTRSHRGQRNSVLVVDGAPEPFLFAAAPPWVEALDRGGVRVMFGVRRGDDSRALIHFSEDGGVTWSTMSAERALEEDEHTLYAANLPTSAQALSLRIEHAGASYETDWTRPRPAARQPSWWKDATVYTILVDRFRPAFDDATTLRTWNRDPGKNRAAGGDLEGIRRSLHYLADLGVDTLYLTPVHVGANVHRYDLVDPLVVDPELGGETAYRRLVSEARALSMRIVQDFSFAHAGAGFPAYADVLRHGKGSRFAAWFVWKDDALVSYGERTDAPLLDLENEEVQALVMEAVELWARLGASGLRLDMTAEVPLALGARIRKRFRELVPDGVVLGEVVPQHAWRWRAHGVVDAATDFGFHELVSELVTSPQVSARATFDRLRELDLLRGGDARSAAVRFLSTHDHPRLATKAAVSGMLARLPVAYALLATWPGIPMLLYGEELGMRSDGARRDLEDVWPDRAPMPWSPGHGGAALRATIRGLLRARRDSRALRYGATSLLFSDDTTVVYRREADGEVVDVALSFGGEPKTIELEDDERPLLTPIAMVGACELSGATLVLAPFGAVVARREKVLGRAIAPVRARRNLALRDREMIDSRSALVSRPSRFFFSVTERCNLQCRHCITHAPELTKSGAARTMAPAVLDALRDDFGLADYFAFVHGGESLTAPIFFDVLEAIRGARGNEPYVAHLLTNGLLLTPSVAERLAAAGLSSLSVSLDGATAEVNDSIRSGGRFDDVVRNVADVLAYRKESGVDLRVGLSFVVLQQNARELGAFVELASRLGVDWLKLEEGVPATEFARKSLVSCAAPPVRTAIDAAVRAGRERGLVVVDHTVERELWRCRLDDEARAFLAADEHANRCAIHPCRTPWETVCIEPNGDARVMDFFGPIAGNVTAVPLAELWNAEVALEARERAKLTRLCGPTGPVTCLTPPA